MVYFLYINYIIAIFDDVNKTTLIFFIGRRYRCHSSRNYQSTGQYRTDWTRGWRTSDRIYDPGWTEGSRLNIISCRSDAARFRVPDYCIKRKLDALMHPLL